MMSDNDENRGQKNIHRLNTTKVINYDDRKKSRNTPIVKTRDSDEMAIPEDHHFNESLFTRIMRIILRQND